MVRIRVRVKVVFCIFGMTKLFFRNDEPKNYFRNDEPSEIGNLHFGMKTCRNEDCSE